MLRVEILQPRIRVRMTWCAEYVTLEAETRLMLLDLSRSYCRTSWLLEIASLGSYKEKQ